jgi:hypothetical protein
MILAESTVSQRVDVELKLVHHIHRLSRTASRKPVPYLCDNTALLVRQPPSREAGVPARVRESAIPRCRAEEVRA